MNRGKWIQYTWIGEQILNTETKKFNLQVDMKILGIAAELREHADKAHFHTQNEGKTNK